MWRSPRLGVECHVADFGSACKRGPLDANDLGLTTQHRSPSGSSLRCQWEISHRVRYKTRTGKDTGGVHFWKWLLNKQDQQQASD